MEITAFAPFFAILLLYACGSERRWVVATLLGSFFQGASPILVTAGGRISGIQPAYGLLPLGVLYWLWSVLEAPKKTSPPPYRIGLPDLFLFALTVIGVCGAILLPRVFLGAVHVMPPNVGFVVKLLRPSGRNIIQAGYMVCNFLLFTLVARSLRRGAITPAQCIGALAFGASITIVLGVYQVAGSFAALPWPSAVLNSNLGVEQLYDQGVDGLHRMSATYLEPSILAMHFLGLFALFALGLRRRLLGGAILMCLLVSTSATAYVGLVMMAALWIINQNTSFDLEKLSTWSLVVSVCAVLMLAGAAVFQDLPGYHLIAQKLASHSGTVRSAADVQGVRTFFESWGLGVGIGSTRSSSFLPTFAACLGIPGLICLFGFFVTLTRASLRSNSRESRAAALGVIGLAIGWSIAVPDLTISLVWLLAGLAYGSVDVPIPVEPPVGQPARPPTRAAAALGRLRPAWPGG